MANLNRAITVNGVTFTLGQLINDPDKYFKYVDDLFRPTTLIVKNNEDKSQYYSRLFDQLYYKKGYRAGAGRIVHKSTNNLVKQNTVASNILSALGIDIIRKSSKNSRIIFKNSGREARISNDDIELLAKKYSNHKTYNHNELDISFGVELEFVAKYNLKSLRDFKDAMEKHGYSYTYTESYCHNKGECWILGRDSSVKGCGCIGFELTSPIMKFNNAKDIKQLKNVIEMIKDILNGRTNKSCGTHIHMSFECGALTADLKNHFAVSYRDNELNFFDNLVPKTRRENENKYCKSVNTEKLYDRYRKLNLTPAEVRRTGLPNKNMHIEFRQLDGTLDFEKIYTWIKLQKLFVENTLYNFKSKSVEHLEIDDIVYDDSFDEQDIENILKMAKIAV